MYTFAQPNHSQRNADHWMKIASNNKSHAFSSIEDVFNYLQQTHKDESISILVTGSLHLIGEVLRTIKEWQIQDKHKYILWLISYFLRDLVLNAQNGNKIYFHTDNYLKIPNLTCLFFFFCLKGGKNSFKIEMNLKKKLILLLSQIFRTKIGTFSYQNWIAYFSTTIPVFFPTLLFYYPFQINIILVFPIKTSSRIHSTASKKNN